MFAIYRATAEQKTGIFLLGEHTKPTANGQEDIFADFFQNVYRFRIVYCNFKVTKGKKYH